MRRFRSNGGSCPGRSRGISPLFFVLLALVSGCFRGRLVEDERIRVEVRPRVVTAGSVCSVKVCAPEDAVEVTGRADVRGSPRYRLKYDEGTGCWTGRGMIPLDAIIRPGVYPLRAEVKYLDGSKGFASVEIEFR